MRIEQELKLGFKDVLFRPKRSTLKSRSQVNFNPRFYIQAQWSSMVWYTSNCS